jgi:hypothetical protein
VKVSTSTVGSGVLLAFLCCLTNLASAQSLGTPQFTSSTLAGCRGSYILDWTSIPDATSYQVWVEHPNTSSYVLAKTETSTEALVVAITASPAGLSFFEVTACDATSCGAFSSPIGLSWYAGCP